jgi:hypothetical protein
MGESEDGQVPKESKIRDPECWRRLCLKLHERAGNRSAI